jgi:hypothetical protein
LRALLISTDKAKMDAKIPKPIKLDVIKKWLEGKSRDQIARELDIGAGTVTGIIKECRKGDPEFDLLRVLSVKLKNEGMGVEYFAPLVRLREVLEEKEWLLDIRREEGVGEDLDQLEKKIECLIISFEVFCVKQGLSVKDFFDMVRSVYLTAE